VNSIETPSCKMLQDAVRSEGAPFRVSPALLLYCRLLQILLAIVAFCLAVFGFRALTTHPLIASLLLLGGTGSVVLLWGLHKEKAWVARLAASLMLLIVLVVILSRLHDGTWLKFGFLPIADGSEGVPLVLLFLVSFTLLASATSGRSASQERSSRLRRASVWSLAVVCALVVFGIAYAPLVWSFAFTPIHEGDELPGPNSMLAALLLDAFAAFVIARSLLVALRSRDHGELR
jgi:hypothetical protein